MFSLPQILPWGRSLSEYKDMFNLSRVDKGKQILSCADGFSSFNTEGTRLGWNIISIDPIYQYDLHEFNHLVDRSFDNIMDQIEKNRHDFIWERFSDIKSLSQYRKEIINSFMADYTVGKNVRYLVGQLPKLSLDSIKYFDIALVSHFLFLYSMFLDESFHLRAIEKLCAISKEVRIFPIVSIDGNHPEFFNRLMDRLEQKGYFAVIKEAKYHFYKGADKMLVVRKNVSE